ncbi:PQQ-like beta-propeller repeat protein [Pelagibacterales bacterium SAG-MED01]|nr:PQQ-like beta-propeller repeat protein [Pelagibacterales bacterium SAG-MED01]
MSKLNFLVITLILFSSCSFNKNSKFWTSSQKINEEKNTNFKEIFPKEEALKKEFNSNLKIKLTTKPVNKTYSNNYLNNNGRLNFDGNLKKSSRYKFSKIDNFSHYQPEISFFKNNVIFFDNKGSILQFNDQSKLIWKNNYYSKSQKKLRPILQFANNEKYLIVADNIAKYYLLDIQNGKLIWSKKNLAPFNSQIKIYKDKFFVIDLTNTLRCFSIKDGSELWSLKTENSLIRTQKKLSMVIVGKKIYFNNSIGDISAVDIAKGELLWQLPTQSSLVYESAFSLKTSDIISDKRSLFFSNNKNQFFSVDINTGSFNWENKINSDLRSTIIDDIIISISLEGYLIITDKRSGNIIRVTDIFQNFKIKKRSKIKPTGFIVGLNKIYLSTSNGRLLVIDIITGKTISVLKIDSEKISKPFVLNKNLFLIKDNSIIKLN